METKKNELYHWGLKKGSTKPNHKYIKREWKNGKWVYYYKDQLTNAISDAKKQIKNKADEASRKKDNLKYTAALKGGIEKKWAAKNAVDKFKNGGSSGDDLIRDVKTAGGYLKDMGYTGIKYGLNNVGRGKMDNKLDSAVKKTTKTLAKAKKQIAKFANKSAFFSNANESVSKKAKSFTKKVYGMMYKDYVSIEDYDTITKYYNDGRVITTKK